MSRAAAVLVFLTGVLWAPRAAAQQGAQRPVEMPQQVVLAKVERPGPRIVLLGMGERFPQEARADVERHTVEELGALGLQVVQVSSQVSGHEPRLAELGAQAALHRAVGAVRITRLGGAQRVQVWIYDTITRKMVLREATSGETDSASVDLGDQVVELLNASLIEIRMRRKRPIRQRLEVVEKMVTAALDPKPGVPDLQLWGAPAVSVGIGGTDPGLSLVVGGGWYPIGWLSLQLESLLPLIPSALAVGEATGSIDALVVRAMAVVEPWWRRSLSPAFGLGAGALILHARGRASAAAPEVADWASSLLLSARLQLGWSISRQIQLVIGGTLSLQLPSIQTEIPGMDSTTVGQPWVDGYLGVRWRGEGR